MATILYIVGALGLVGVVFIAVLNALGHLSDASIVPSIVAAFIAVLILGFGRALDLLQSIDRRLRRDVKAPSAVADDARLPTEQKNAPQRFRYGDFRIEAFEDGTYVVRGPGMKPKRFRDQDALDAFLAEQR